VNQKDSIQKTFFLVLFVMLSFLLYLPVLGHFFVSDDFKVLNRVCNNGIIFIPGFFRPLSDLTIYANFLVGGLHPLVYNSFNILVHALNGFLLFILCLSAPFGVPENRKLLFAFSVSVLFLSYPFHNEGVVWLLGRGASMACFFSLGALLIYHKIGNRPLKIFCVCICYFIGLSAFESILFFPLIFFIWIKISGEPQKKAGAWMLFLTLTLLLHLALRRFVSGYFLGSYGEGFLDFSLRSLSAHAAKTAARLMLPPMQQMVWFTVLAFFVFLLAGIFIVRQFRNPSPRSHILMRMIGMLAISCFIPILTGISVHSSESDRFLYFPSVFLCLSVGYVIVTMVERALFRYVLILAIGIYQLIFLEINNRHWKQAGKITRAVVKSFENNPVKGKSIYLNLPEEIGGAFVFRMGFQDALLLYRLDTTRYVSIDTTTGIPGPGIPDTASDAIKGKLINEAEYHWVRNSLSCPRITRWGLPWYETTAYDRIFIWQAGHLKQESACIAVSR